MYIIKSCSKTWKRRDKHQKSCTGIDIYSWFTNGIHSLL